MEEEDDVLAASTPNQSGVFGIMPARTTGLQQLQSSDRKRTACVLREDPALSKKRLSKKRLSKKLGSVYLAVYLVYL